jgi:fumarylacetoacetase
MIEANNPALKTWLDMPVNSDFPIQNIPFGVVRLPHDKIRCATRIGDTVIDLYGLAKHGYLDGVGIRDYSILKRSHLNDFIALGKPFWQALRDRISKIFGLEKSLLRDNHLIHDKILYPIDQVEVLMPVKVGDYTDFYSSIEHATNVGKMFRDPDNALLPNWKHIPVGYHGRSSSIVISGTNIHRPKGQTKADDADIPSFGPSRLVDFELEMAFIAGRSTGLGDSVAVGEAEDHIFGLVLFNDLSARDIQKWEYVPLGPFLSKNFGSVISPWIVTLDALEPFRVKGPEQNPRVLPYLEYNGNKNYNIHLEVAIRPEGSEESTVCRSNFSYMYWNMCQQLAHHTVNGCNINVGDMFASGTISGPEPGSFGSMLEITWRGTKPVKLSDGSERKFINETTASSCADMPRKMA